MANKQANQYIPDYIVPPGEVLEDYLESLGMTQAELAARTGSTWMPVRKTSIKSP
jgi:plasmid maintenance system antidote protein VapI